MTAPLPRNPIFADTRRAAMLLLVVAAGSLAGSVLNAAHAGPVASPAQVVLHQAVAGPDEAMSVAAGLRAHRLPRNAQRHVGTAEPKRPSVRPAASEV